MKKTLILLTVATMMVSPGFASTDLVTAVKPTAKHVAKDVAAPFVYVAKGLGAGFKHLGKDLHIVKK